MERHFAAQNSHKRIRLNGDTNVPNAESIKFRLTDEQPDKRISRKWNYTFIKSSAPVADFITDKQNTGHSAFRRATLIGYSLTGVESAETVYFIRITGFPVQNFSNDSTVVPLDSIPILLPTGVDPVVKNDVFLPIFDNGSELVFPQQFEIHVTKKDHSPPPLTEIILHILFED